MRRLKNIKLVVFILLIFSVRHSYGQTIEKALMNTAANHSAEKIFIHYDKEYYVAGETIWFKVYLYNNTKPDGLSNTLYLQFTNSKGEVVAAQKYPVVGATVKGNINIPDSLPQGNYYIRSFTPRMLNYDESFTYQKNIFIFRPINTPPATKLPKTISLTFFPESGHLVDGILSVVAFKATDQWGTPEEINGTIKSDDGTNIASFKTYHDGIGKVQFKPIAGKKYIAEVETEAGKRTYNLAAVEAVGINLKIQDEPGGKKFQLTRSAKGAEQFDVLKIVAVINNQLIYENEIAFEDYPSVIGHIVTDSLPSGILHFTVFDKTGKPLAERLSFVDNGEYRGTGEIVAIKKGIDKRAENSYDLNFTDPIQRSCSVSIIDLASTTDGDAENIWSRLLLTTDLKGYVYNPAWYFEKQNDSTKLALDNLLLTHGWTRFSWDKILAGDFPAKQYNDESLITVKGKVTENGKPVSGGKLNIFLEAAELFSRPYEVKVDPAGNFLLDSLVYRGKGEFFYAYTDKNEKPKPGWVVLESNPMDKIMVNVLPVNLETAGRKMEGNIAEKKEIDARAQQVKSMLNEVKELENVTVDAKSSKRPADIVNEKYTTGAFRSPGKVTIDNVNDPPTDKAMNGVDFVKNRIQQLMLDAGRFVNRKNFSLSSGRRWDVGVFINEQPADLLQLRLLRADEIALVKFYEAGFVGVSSTFPGGAVAVYTNEMKAAENKPDKLEMFEYNGYTVTKEFYSPDYNVPNPRHKLADNRTTLYWNPDVFTDAETKSVKLHFFNNDFSKKFKVIVEGFDVNGKLIHLEKVVE